MKRKNIFVFTGGGLSPSLNPTLAGVVAAAQQRGWRVYGGRKGWASMLPGGTHLDLSRLSVKSLAGLGGAFLTSSRTNPIKYPGGRRFVEQLIKKLKLDAVVAIGGDDTLSAAQQLYLEDSAFIFGIPKTIDNDIPGTYYAPGFATAAECLGQMVYELRERAAKALSRIFIIESMGLHAGWLPAAGGYLGGADLIVVPEQVVHFNYFLSVLKRRYLANGGYAMVVVSQEARFIGGVTGLSDDQADDYAVSRHQFLCLGLKQLVKQRLGIDTKAILPGNLLESADPNAIDKKISLALGRSTVEQIARGGMPTFAVVERVGEKLQVRHRPWHGIDLDPNPGLTVKDFDFKKFQVTRRFINYLRPLQLKFWREKK